MRVSVVLCTYSSEMYAHFRDAAESILSQTYRDLELVIIVDGNETICERIRREYDGHTDVVLHCNDENRGLLSSRNKGADLATGDVVAFIDDDAVADADWVEELVRSYETRAPLAVGGKMVPEWVAGKPRFLPEEFYWLVGATHRGFADGAEYVRNTFGSNISFKRDIFLTLGGFDTDIGGRKGDRNLQGGETELCARLVSEYGEEVWYNPEAIVAHKVFDYRTDPNWLLGRAFWQGYSKWIMKSLLGNGGDEESEYLQRIVTESLPGRVQSLVRNPSIARASQLVMVMAFTAAVGSGYVYGALRNTMSGH